MTNILEDMNGYALDMKGRLWFIGIENGKYYAELIEPQNKLSDKIMGNMHKLLKVSNLYLSKGMEVKQK